MNMKVDLVDNEKMEDTIVCLLDQYGVKLGMVFHELSRHNAKIVDVVSLCRFFAQCRNSKYFVLDFENSWSTLCASTVT